MCPNKMYIKLFAKNLNDFNIHLFGQTVYYSVSPSLTVPFDLCVARNLPNFM